MTLFTIEYLDSRPVNNRLTKHSLKLIPSFSYVYCRFFNLMEIIRNKNWCTFWGNGSCLYLMLLAMLSVDPEWNATVDCWLVTQCSVILKLSASSECMFLHYMFFISTLQLCTIGQCGAMRECWTVWHNPYSQSESNMDINILPKSLLNCIEMA